MNDPYAMPETPDWLNSGDATKPLEGELSSADKYYDVSKYLRAMNRAAQSQFGMDLQEGQFAAGEATSRALQNGTQGSVNTSQIAASTALPGMQNKLNTAAEGAKIALQAQMANQQARASLASSIADTRAKYSSVLANFISTTRGQNISGFNMGRSNEIAQENADTNKQSIWASLLGNPKIGADISDYAKKMLGIGGSSGGSSAIGYSHGYSGDPGSPLIPASNPSPTGTYGAYDSRQFESAY